MRKILGKTMDQWLQEHPLLEKMMAYEEVTWLNTRKGKAGLPITIKDMEDAEARLRRFAPFLATVFPETRQTSGIIESPLITIDKMKEALEKEAAAQIPGRMMLKADHLLPVAGSVKARGGMYEVLKLAETIALTQGRLSEADDYSKLLSAEYKSLFSAYSLAVGSTGNLGLSIGITGAALGFQTTVHMSADAKEWKKKLLRKKGVHVVEYDADYSKAVEEGRKQSEGSPNSYFVDDEQSVELFLGYTTAAIRLKKQLQEANIKVDSNHPLFVYLPCGVGGAPGGIFTGLKLLFGENVYGFFAEPVHSPCMLLGVMTGEHEAVAVQDFGIDNITAADGLAVGRPSRFVGQIVEKEIDGLYSVSDDYLFKALYQLFATEGLQLEPSALAGMAGPSRAKASGWLEANFSSEQLSAGTHIIWSTGGSLVPSEEMDKMITRGEAVK